MALPLVLLVLGIAVAALIGTVQVAVAKPHDIRAALKLETLSAIHAPTGCASMVEYDDGAFVQAFITDPLCLPSGVTRRFIPSSERDFYGIDPLRAAVITR